MFEIKTKCEERSFSDNSMGYSSNDSPTKSSIFTNTMSQSESKSCSGEKKGKSSKCKEPFMSAIMEVVTNKENSSLISKNASSSSSSVAASANLFDYLFMSHRPNNNINANTNNLYKNVNAQVENNSLHEAIENNSSHVTSHHISKELETLNSSDKYKYIMSEIKHGELLHFDANNKKTISIITENGYHEEVNQLAEMYQHILANYREIENIALEYRTMANKDSLKFPKQIETNSNMSNIMPSSSSSTNHNMLNNERDNPFKVTYKLAPMKIHERDHNFSRKVFVGGFGSRVPLPIVQAFFAQFGHLEINLPLSYSSHEITKGFCYLIFKENTSVSYLIDACQICSKGYFINFDDKKVQVIPWNVNDTEYSIIKANEYQRRRVWNQSLTIKPQQNKLTVFVGALHGTISAEALFIMFNTLFGNANYAALDTDRYHYPVGSGRVTFTCLPSYELAVKTNLVVVQSESFTKTIQIDPYLEDSMCQTCTKSPGVYFCRNNACFKYFCPPCWSINHKTASEDHMPIRRTFNTMLMS